MSDAINLANITSVDKEKFIEEFTKYADSEISSLLKNLKSDEDRVIVRETAKRMTVLYQQMYMVESQKERNSVQRQLNNYKSAVAAISARHELDIANAIIKICKKAAVLALSAAVSFVAL